MALSFKRKKFSFNYRITIYVILALLISIIQVLTFDLIEIEGITTNLLIVLTVWMSLYEGRLYSLFGGFLSGLIFDIISFDVIGTNALSLTLAAFVSGFFFREGKYIQIIGSFKFPFIVLLSAFFHNLVYYFFYIDVSDLNFWSFFLKYGLASSFYTTAFSLFVMLFMMRKKY